MRLPPLPPSQTGLKNTWQLLIQDDLPATENAETTVYSTLEGTSDGGVYLKQQSAPTTQVGSGQDYTYGRNANFYPPNGDTRPRDNPLRDISNLNDDITYMQDGPSDVFYDGGSGNNDSQTRVKRPQFEKYAKRTVFLINLPEGVTHAEVVDVVRGGMLLDIYVRPNDRIASVSFLEEADAEVFYRHVKRHDLYIRGKRVWYLLASSILYMLTYSRLRFAGTIVNSFCHLMLPTRLELGPRETWSSETAIQNTPKRLFVTTWSISTILL